MAEDDESKVEVEELLVLAQKVVIPSSRSNSVLPPRGPMRLDCMACTPRARIPTVGWLCARAFPRVGPMPARRRFHADNPNSKVKAGVVDVLCATRHCSGSCCAPRMLWGWTRRL